MNTKMPSHLDANGHAKMVDIGEKSDTARMARATAKLLANPETIQAIWHKDLKKGDALTTAQIAGIQAAKKTADLIPMCHTLLLNVVEINFERAQDGIVIQSEVKLTGKTGAEMEALTAVTVAGLTLYDMAKSIQKDMILTDTRLIYKSGGKSGDVHAN